MTQTVFKWGLQGRIYSSVLWSKFLYLLTPNSCVWFLVDFRQTVVLLVNSIRSQFAVSGLGNVRWCWRQWLFLTGTYLAIHTLYTVWECKTHLTSAQDSLLGDKHLKFSCFNTKFRCLSVLLDLALGHQIRIVCLHQFIFF